MTTARRKAYWARAHEALCRERGLFANKRWHGLATPQDERLLKHIDRELNWYEMAIMRPNFERMEREIRKRTRLARSIHRFIGKVRAGEHVREADAAH